MNIIQERQAVIIGGGIAGLLAARVLCKHFDKVIIIEKDKYPSQAGSRNGVPQSNHIHVLLIKGKEILLELFPDLEKKLVAKRAHVVNLTNDVLYYVGTGYSIRFESDLTTIACTRQLLEHEIRNEIVANFPNVNILESTRATGLLIEKELGICTGVTTLSADTNYENTILGDLVVDASGRESKTSEWLDKLGYGKPEETTINSYIGYSTCWFRSPTSQQTSGDTSSSVSYVPPVIKPTIILTSPPFNPRMGVIYPVEGSLWLVGILGIGKKYPQRNRDFCIMLENWRPKISTIR